MKLYCLQQSTVSILVVLDVVLEVETGYTETRSTRVSILVVLDVVLEDNFFVLQRTYHFRFNPCCAGCSSGSLPFRLSSHT